jgi:hypothetical protein
MVLATVTMPRIDTRNPVQESLHILEQANEVAYFGKINPSYIFNHGEVPRLMDSIQVARLMEEPGNVLITSRQEIQRAPGLLGTYEVLYSGKDLFDLNHTVILGPAIRR